MKINQILLIAMLILISCGKNDNKADDRTIDGHDVMYNINSYTYENNLYMSTNDQIKSEYHLFKGYGVELPDTIANTTGTTAGTGDGDLYYPESVNSFVDNTTFNYVLAANTLNNRVEAFSNAAAVLTFQANFGSP